MQRDLRERLDLALALRFLRCCVVFPRRGKLLLLLLGFALVRTQEEMSRAFARIAESGVLEG